MVANGHHARAALFLSISPLSSTWPSSMSTHSFHRLHAIQHSTRSLWRNHVCIAWHRQQRRHHTNDECIAAVSRLAVSRIAAGVGFLPAFRRSPLHSTKLHRRIGAQPHRRTATSPHRRHSWRKTIFSPSNRFVQRVFGFDCPVICRHKLTVVR